MLLIAGTGLKAQVSCSGTTPVFTIDMTGTPDSVWTSPATARDGQCCGASTSDKCIRFDVTLDAKAQGLTVLLVGGTGSTVYNVNCGAAIPIGDTICLTGATSYTITICKPGTNIQNYVIASVPKPGIDQDEIKTSAACSKLLSTTGLAEGSITWKSVGNNTTYNSYLSCTSGCDTTHITLPQSGFPSYVDYVVSGYNKNLTCDTNLVYDTVRVFMYNNPSVTISPKPAGICFGSTTTSVTASASGGLSPYQLLWSTAATSSTVALPVGTHWVRVTDSLGCYMGYDTVTAYMLPQIIANAGADTSICSSNNAVYLNGSVTNATGGVWTGRGGHFIGDSTTLNPTYVPSYEEVQAGSTYLVLTTTGTGNCSAVSDTLHITIYNAPMPIIAGDAVICEGATNTNYTVTPTTGHTYDWHVVGGTITSGQNTASINVTWGSNGPGYIYMVQTDTAGCQGVGAINTISSFDFNYSSLIKASIGPDAISVDADAYSDGSGFKITQNCGSNKGIDLVVPGSVFDRGKICMTYSWQRDENFADFFTRGGVTFRIRNGALEIGLRVDDGNGGYTDVGPVTTGYTVPNDDIHRYFTFCYDSATGVGVAMQFDSVVWTYNGTAGRSLYWSGAGDANIGNVMDGSCYGKTLLDWSNISIPITIIPIPSANLSGPDTVCQYQTANYELDDTASYYSYNWTVDGGQILNGQSTDEISVQWDSTGTRQISVLLTDTVNGCDTTITYTVGVFAHPLASISGADSICQSIENVFVAPSGSNYSYQWGASTGTFSGGSTDDTATIIFTQGGTHTISLTVTHTTSGCDSSITYSVFVDSLPIGGISGNTPLCEGSTGYTYQTASNGLYSYTWSVSGGNITAGAGTNAVTIDWPSAGTFNVRTIVEKAYLGCQQIFQYPVTITAKPVTGAIQH